MTTRWIVCLSQNTGLHVYGGPAQPCLHETGSVVAVDDVMAIVPVMWARRCRGSARDGANSAADRRTDTGATSASRDRANNRPGPGANQATAQRSVGRIIRIRERGRRQHHTSGN